MPEYAERRTGRCVSDQESEVDSSGGAIFRTFLAVLFGLVLTANRPVGEPHTSEESEPAMEKEIVTDPTTGKMVTAPEYGGTLTYPFQNKDVTTDPFLTGHLPAHLIGSVNERIAWGNWGIDRDEFDFRTTYLPDFAITGQLAESWDTPDPLTYIFHIRQGVHWALDPDSEASRLVNGRELTADDVVYSFQRNLGRGDFTESSARKYDASNLPVHARRSNPCIGPTHGRG